MKFETPHHVVTHITIPAKDHFESGKTLRNNLLSVRRNEAMSFGDETLLEGDNRAMVSLSMGNKQRTLQIAGKLFKDGTFKANHKAVTCRLGGSEKAGNIRHIVKRAPTKCPSKNSRLWWDCVFVFHRCRFHSLEASSGRASSGRAWNWLNISLVLYIAACKALGKGWKGEWESLLTDLIVYDCGMKESSMLSNCLNPLGTESSIGQDIFHPFTGAMRAWKDCTKIPPGPTTMWSRFLYIRLHKWSRRMERCRGSLLVEAESCKKWYICRITKFEDDSQHAVTFNTSLVSKNEKVANLKLKNKVSYNMYDSWLSIEARW